MIHPTRRCGAHAAALALVLIAMAGLSTYSTHMYASGESGPWDAPEGSSEGTGALMDITADQGDSNLSDLLPGVSGAGDLETNLTGNLSLPDWNGTNLSDYTNDLVDGLEGGSGKLPAPLANVSLVGKSPPSDPIFRMGGKVASAPGVTIRYVPSIRDVQGIFTPGRTGDLYSRSEQLPVMGEALVTSRVALKGAAALTMNNVVGRLPFIGGGHTPMPAGGMDGKTAAGVGMLSFTTMLLSVFLSGGGKQSAAMLMAPLAYTRLQKGDILRHELRNRIYQEVLKNPGINLLALKKTLDIENGVLAYHLATLERENFVKSHRDGRMRRLYVRGYRAGGLSTMQQSILDIIAEAPRISQKAIADHLQVSKQTVNYHIKRLEREGFISVERRGKECCCVLLRQGS